MKTFVYIELSDDPSAHGAPLAHAWVYWREGRGRLLLRTDAKGLVFELRARGEPENPFHYTRPFVASLGASVRLGCSRLAFAIPDAILDDHPEAFSTRTLDLEDDDGDDHDAFPEAELPERPREVSDRLITEVLRGFRARPRRGAIEMDPKHLFAPDDPDVDARHLVTTSLLGIVAQRQPRPRQPRNRRRHAPVAPHAPAPAPAQPPAQPVPITTNTLVPAPYVRVVLPDIRLEVTTPEELGIWPLRMEQPTDVHLTDGLPQGADGLNARGLRVTENAAAPAAPNSRPRECGLVIRGSIDARATALNVEITGLNGTPVDLLPEPALPATARSIPVQLKTPAGALRPFEATIFLAVPVAALGLVRIVFQATGTPVPIVEALVCQLAGVQIALVNDHDANDDGSAAGPVPSEANDKIVVDFLSSPEATRDDLTAKLRVRRMVLYPIARRERALSATTPAIIQKPEMPMWMGELHLVGVTLEGLEWLLVFRHLFQPQHQGRARHLRIEATWKLGILWEGSDWKNGHGGDRAHRTNFTLPDAHIEVLLGLARDRVNAALLTDPVRIVSRMTPAPVQLTFPTSHRRRPGVLIAARSWGRTAGAATASTLVLEWQPKLAVDERGATREIFRGGNGTIEASAPRINARDVDPGIDRVTRAPATSSELRIPTFRVPGTNPQADDEHIDVIVNALVAEYHAAHHTEAPIQVLHLQTWQATLRLLVRHESKHMHFRVQGAPIAPSPTARIKFAGEVFGHQHDMPLFGPPHGYGFSQLDKPAPTDDQVWSFVENIRGAVKLTMNDKAHSAFRALGANLQNDHLSRAVFQREVVRRYNGATEFRWNGHAFEIRPSNAQMKPAGTPNNELRYPSEVLHTPIAYWTGAGATATFSWPIAFGRDPTDFGELTELVP